MAFRIPSTNTFLIQAFVLLACVYLVSLWLSLPVYLAAVLKVAPILCLLTLALKAPQRANFLVGALVFSALGDVLLALPIEHSFVLGLGAFLIAQSIYAAGFFVRRAQPISAQHKGRLFFVLVISLALATIILPRTGALAMPVTVYLLAIAAMAATAATVPKAGAALFCGALLFVLSDACIAINKFVYPFNGSDIAIMSTYYGAQALICYGVLRHQRQVQR
ncbi:lysoplasmalogenase [Simiduia sp. 21SJ11W-1]|uniref:lysoplasmalogenase n=1 Tax=Simiduia sp. 21SJ11W-1 TaxID=2909669 RepID=UPI0020A201B6|nr:lysoplasmalogenase [Simiduia sp. 21SJ11W-1]UTA47014.1 lysoplasmalogenase [Simiduia sp. 21SJ11W-1]